MAADLHIHVVLDDGTEKHVRGYLQKEWTTYTTGMVPTKGYTVYEHRDGRTFTGLAEIPEDVQPEDIIGSREVILDYDSNVVDETPSCWIGEVSWLKAGLFGDNGTFIPDAVGDISDLIGRDLPVLTEELADKIVAALSLPNKTNYAIANPDDVRSFLQQHIGKKVFQISW